LDLDPNDASFWHERALAKLNKGDWSGVITDETGAIWRNSRLAEAYDGRGQAHWAQGNLKAALDDYNSALALNPRLADCWYHRALIKSRLKDRTGTIADCSEALKLNPRYAMAYCERGLAKGDMGDYDGAIADVTTALGIDPKSPYAFVCRVRVEILQGDLAGAAADSERAIQMNPRFGLAHGCRANVEYLRRDWASALGDYHLAYDYSGTDRDPVRLSIWITRARLGKRQAADEELASWLDMPSQRNSRSWISMHARFLLGRISDKELLASVDPAGEGRVGDDLCRTLYHVGVKKLLDGDSAAAAETFRQCLATGEKDQVSCHFAQAELTALGDHAGE
jgi:serine/threonine-protein kinase